MLSVLFAMGWFDRVAAVLIWYVLACLFGRNPLTANPALPYVGVLLLAHAILPPSPFGALSARNRTDPAGGWEMSTPVFAVVWILMAVGYSYSGYTKLASESWVNGSALSHVLHNPLARPTPLRVWLLELPAWVLQAGTWGGLGIELLFAPLALVRKLRPWIWLALLGMHLGLMVLIDFADLSLGMVMLHLFTFAPAWIPRREAVSSETLFYDGGCGFCHKSIRFLLAEDTAGVLRFAPLAGEAGKDLPDELPDSLVLRTGGGELLTRSAGFLTAMSRLGGCWRLLAAVATIVPRPVRDAAYDGIARIRHRLFAPPADVCPILPPELRSRFLAGLLALLLVPATAAREPQCGRGSALPSSYSMTGRDGRQPRLWSRFDGWSPLRQADRV